MSRSPAATRATAAQRPNQRPNVRTSDGSPPARWLRGLAWLGAIALIVACSTNAGGKGAGPASATSASRASSAACRTQHWVGAWRAPPGDAERSFADQTLRLIVAPHLAAHVVRARLSNRFGQAELTVDSVTMGIWKSGAEVRRGTTRRVRFDGQGGTTIPRGARAVSDPVTLAVAPTDDIVVTVYLRHVTGPLTQHLTAAENATYVASGNHVDDEDGAAFTTHLATWFLLEGIDVLAPASTGALAVLGDSITAGYRSTTGRRRGEHDTRYPDFIAYRLRRAKQPMAVLNLGLSGNRLLTDDAQGGASALARIDDDILGAPGVTDVLVLEGINDIGRSGASARQVIAGFHQLVLQLQDMDLEVTVATIMPAGGASPAYGDASASRTRSAVNDWIRRSGVPDAVVDFDAALRDPEHPSRLRPRYDSGDHLHPNARGYQAMAESVDLSRLRGAACAG